MGKKIFADVNMRLYEIDLMMHGGKIVNAILMAAPKSTKTRKVNEILKCTRLRKAVNGTSE